MVVDDRSLPAAKLIPLTAFGNLLVCVRWSDTCTLEGHLSCREKHRREAQVSFGALTILYIIYGKTRPVLELTSTNQHEATTTRAPRADDP